MPNHVGLAVGLGQAAFGLGTIMFSGLFSSLTHWYGTDNAVWLSGFILGVPVLFATFLLSWPESQLCDEECGEQEMAYTPISSHPTDHTVQGEKIRLAVLSRSSSFLFGAKTLMTVLLALQTLAFLSLGLATYHSDTFWIFVLASIVLFITFSGGACLSAILATDPAESLVQLKFRGSFFILAITSFIGLICAKFVTKSKHAFSHNHSQISSEVVSLIDVRPIS